MAIRELAVAHGTSVLTFNSTCYGRLLRAIKDSPLTPVDCYCYSLSQNAVTACWCAPTTLEQLDQNLQALESPELSLKRANLLRHFGDRVYEEDKVFHRLVRSR